MNKFCKTSFMLFLILGSFQIFGQQLVKEGNQWNVFFPATFDPITTTSQYVLSGDTIVEGQTYLKMAIKDRITEELNFIDVYLREDTTKKVFLKRNFGSEILLYDFGLELDDIFESNYCSLKVVAIDSVLTNNGELRKRYEFEGIESAYQTTYWIEGVGSIHSVIDHVANFCFFDVPATLLCFYEDGELSYPQSPPACIINDVDDLSMRYELEVYPNPFQDKIYIKDPKQAFDEIQIFNSLGQLLKSKILNSSLNEMSLPNLEVGIYYLSFRNKNGVIYNQRIVHQ